MFTFGGSLHSTLEGGTGQFKVRSPLISSHKKKHVFMDDFDIGGRFPQGEVSE